MLNRFVYLRILLYTLHKSGHIAANHGLRHGRTTGIIGDRAAVPYSKGDVREEDYPGHRENRGRVRIQSVGESKVLLYPRTVLLLRYPCSSQLCIILLLCSVISLVQHMIYKPFK